MSSLEHDGTPGNPNNNGLKSGNKKRCRAVFIKATSFAK
jgi:hypothetical protein